MTHERDGKHHRGREYPRVSAAQQEAQRDRTELEAQLDTALMLMHDKDARVDALAAVNAAQAAEIVTLTAEVERWREEHNRRTQHVVDATLRKLEREEYNV